MQLLLRALAAGLLFTACIAGVQVTFAVAAAGEALADLHIRAARTLDRAEATGAVLQAAAVEQRRYYKATGKALAIATVDFARMVKATDDRLERVTRQVEMTAAETRRTFADGRQVLHTADSQLYGAGYEAQASLAAVRGAAERIGGLAQDPALAQAAASLERSAANIERGTAAAADVAISLRDATSPRKRRFWSTLLQWIVPRPSIPIRP